MGWGQFLYALTQAAFADVYCVHGNIQKMRDCGNIKSENHEAEHGNIHLLELGNLIPEIGNYVVKISIQY